MKTETKEAIASLKKYLKPGATVYTVLRHCSSSGMSRSIDLVVIHKKEPFCISWLAGRAMGYRVDQNNGGLKTHWGGMDIGFSLVYNLGRTLFPKGFIPSRAGKCERNGESPDKLDTDGGYALNHRWL